MVSGCDMKVSICKLSVWVLWVCFSCFYGPEIFPIMFMLRQDAWRPSAAVSRSAPWPPPPGPACAPPPPVAPPAPWVLLLAGSVLREPEVLPPSGWKGKVLFPLFFQGLLHGSATLHYFETPRSSTSLEMTLL